MANNWILMNEVKADILADTINNGFGRGGTSTNLHVGLFKTNYTPTPTDTLAGTYVPIECDFPGYARTLINSSVDWSVPVLLSGQGISQAPFQTFVASVGIVVPQTAYGYFICYADDTKLLLAGQFDVPQTVALPGDPIVLTPTMTDNSEF